MKVPFLSSVINQRSMTLNSALQSTASWLKTFKSNKCSLIGSSIVNTSDHNWYCTNFHFSIHSRHYLKWITSTLFSKSSYLASGLFWINSMTIWKKRNRTVKSFVYTYEYVLQEWRTNWGDYLFLWYLTHSNFFSHEVHKWHVLLWCLHQYILRKSCHQIIRYFLVLTEDLVVILHPWNESK